LLRPRLTLACLVHTFVFSFSTAPATTDLSTLSLHDALPIYTLPVACLYRQMTGTPVIYDAREFYAGMVQANVGPGIDRGPGDARDRKSTRLNSSHVKISYAVFCLKKKRKPQRRQRPTKKACV